MTDRLPSGNARLDAVLGGGLPANAVTLVVGPPGSGKTILAQSYSFKNATPQRPAIYLSTVSEPFEKILRYGHSLTFFDPAKVGKSVFYDDLGGILNEQGLGGVASRLGDLIKERRPGVLVVDSFKALRPYAEDEGHFRRFLHEVAGMVSAFPVSSFWVGEYDFSEMTTAPEFAVADGILFLSTTRSNEREMRTLQVLKLRGSESLTGKHAYRITSAGLSVFPRLADPVNQADYSLRGERITSGIQALDDMLADGYWSGTSTLVAGPSGSGKTLMGMHFIFKGAEAGESGIIATLQENPTQLERIVQKFGWSLDSPGVEVMYRSPVDIHVDEWVYDLLDTAERTGATRILVDSLGDLRNASPDESRFREYLYSLLSRCSRAGVSLMLTFEIPDLYGSNRLSEFGVSHLSDNVVLLQYVRAKSNVKRAMLVLKTRASAHEPEIREFRITREGIVLGDPIDQDSPSS